MRLRKMPKLNQVTNLHLLGLTALRARAPLTAMEGAHEVHQGKVPRVEGPPASQGGPSSLMPQLASIHAVGEQNPMSQCMHAAGAAACQAAAA